MNIAVDIGGTNIRVALLDNSTVINRNSIPCPSYDSEEEVLKTLISQIYKCYRGDITKIGIGVPSIVDTVEGVVYNVVNIPSWKEVHLKKILESEFKVPVAVNNDANCFALGAKYFGQGRTYQDMVGVTLGTGVGIGVIVNGQLYNGANTSAGEIGAISYLDADYETYCSTPFFKSKANIDGKEAARRAKEGDKAIQDLWYEFGTHVGNLFKTILLAYDPQAIIVGGGFSDAYTLYKDGIEDSMKQFLYPTMIDKLHIHICDTPDMNLLGASML